MKRKKRKSNTTKKTLRAGSKEVKKILYAENPKCDICNYEFPIKIIQLHHVFLVRHGFPTVLEHCVLLCPDCHIKFHKKFDKYLDKLNEENHDTDFMKIYKECKKDIL